MPIRKPVILSPSAAWTRRLNGYFIAFARRVFHWSPAYREVVQRSERGERGEKRYLCGKCGALVERSEKQVDHIEPVIKVGAPWSGSWDEYRDRLFVDAGSLRVLCKPCHQSKSKKENETRRRIKRESR